jgi:hypothetical protein
MYVHGSDLELLLERLDGDDELAWLVPTNPGSWKATAAHPEPLLATYKLWHIPSGPLPLIPPHSPAGLIKRDPGSPEYEGGWIDDPWSGWEEQSGTTNPTPNFCDALGWPGAYKLMLRLAVERGEIGISTFTWVGSNRYNPPDPATERHWRRLRTWVGRSAQKVTRGDLEGRRPEIFAFPSALEAIRNGTPRATNPLPPWPGQFADGSRDSRTAHSHTPRR